MKITIYIRIGTEENIVFSNMYTTSQKGLEVIEESNL